jgi:predicted O-linked N-acetylglucosamine transferase (SPINDLY family)
MKPGRNDPCPCGSGRKYKQCCGVPGRAAMVSVPQLLQSALASHQAGQLQQAEALYRQALAAAPDHPDALHLLGVLCYQSGRPEAAVDLIGRALAAKPAFPHACLNLGIALQSLGRAGEAAAACQRAIALSPGYAEAHYTLGVALKDLGRVDDAAAEYSRAIALNPDYAEAHHNLGALLNDLGRAEEAAQCCRRALALKPDYAMAHYNLGLALQRSRHLEEAVASYRRATELRPEFAEAHNNLGIVLNDLGRFGEAAAACRRAIAALPSLADAHNNLGNALKDGGMLDEAIECYRRALELRPDLAVVQSSLLFLLNYHEAYDPEALFGEHLAWARRHAEPLSALAMPHGNDPDPSRRLKIGYVSADLRDHAVAYFLEPVLEHHEPSRVEVYCYGNHPRVDDVTLRLQEHTDHWRSIAGMSDEAAAALIRADAIDILIDLSGHTAHNRLTLFARRPAPVQATWIGYPNTTGMSAMDYRLTDANLDPIGMTGRYHSEQLVRLPVSACFRPAVHAPEVGELPALAAGHITFASFNNFTKVTAETIACWSQVLEAVPASRLMLLIGEAENPDARQRVEALFARHGIAPERLQLVGRRPLAEYLALHQQVDIALDPFPYNGGTTSVHSLWMGVPVVTLAGSTAVSRVGVTILANAGLAELIAQSVDEYVEIARSLAQDTARLGRMRAGLRADLQASPLFDAEALTRALEESYRNMWKIWCTRKIDETRTQ